MIYITGDTHASFIHRFNTGSFPEQKEMTKDDFVIICGDFGGVWERDGESKAEKYWLDWFESRPYTLLFIDGNHENFDRLYSYPEKMWRGGRVHELRPHVLHLMRGQVFDLGGKMVFTFGGASSHDISGGILKIDDPNFSEKKKKLEIAGLSYRVDHVSWWAKELADEEEMEEGRTNLLANNNKVDFIITHCCASSTQAIIGGGMYKPDMMTKYFEDILQTVTFKKWFFGHYHDNRNVSDKEILIYEQLIRIA